MNPGYDKFFKQAKKVKGLGSPARSGKDADPIQNSAMSKTPERQMASILKKRMIARRRKAAKKNRPPMMAVTFLVFGLAIATWGLINPGFMDKISRHLELGWLMKADAETAPPAEKSSATKDEDAAKNSSADRTEASVNTSATKNWTPEDISHFNKLNERKKQLDLREAELSELEEELHKQKVEIEARIQKLDETRSQIARILKDKVRLDDEKVNKLVDMYSNMKAKQAAEIFGTIDEDLAVEILGRMKKKNAAEIMNLLKAEKAKILSEKFAGYKRR